MANLDPTFRSYSADQAAAYAEHRGSAYAPAIIEAVLSHHRHGRFDCVLDVGCGTGSATRSLAPSFNHAIGCDPGGAMIDRAISLGGLSKGGSHISYEVLPAERVSQSSHAALGSVDLLTASMAVRTYGTPLYFPLMVGPLVPYGSVLGTSRPHGPSRRNCGTVDHVVPLLP